MAKTCVICGGDEEADGNTLLEAPCQRHWVCSDDVGSFFERATEYESLYPPKCCGQLFALDLYESYVPFDVQWAYQMKEQGEYSVLAKYRVYCANPTCSKFLNPDLHVKDPSSKVSYAVCVDDACGKLTCTTCKMILDGFEGHICEKNEDYKKFKQTATEKGFQECPTCASTVELAEACNHITCKCGAAFCYICGESWPGTHGCPHYGPAIYDEEGYNQEGYQRTTGLNRDGRTRREQERLIQNGNDGDDQDDQDDEEDDDADQHFILQHVDAAMRATFAALPHQDREAFLMNLQIQLFEERGITFPLPDDDGSVDNSDIDTDNENPDSDDDADEVDGDDADSHEGADEDRQGDVNISPGDPSELSDSLANAISVLEESLEVVEPIIEDFTNATSSSVGTPDNDLPGTPMDVDSEEDGGKREREPGVQAPGSWPDDEEL